MPASLVLASKSPRRSELLRLAGIPFTVRAADVPEVPQAGEAPLEYVRRLSQSKAGAVALAEGEIVLGADTIVVSEGRILEKPADATDAGRMLRLISGRTHEVITGVCLRTADGDHVETESTLVRFVDWKPDEIDAYIQSGQCMDKAGAYAIQGLAAKFIDRIEGCYFNVVGLPIARVYRMLAGRI